jgi:1-acyl-sn-glycerol-3-phosphate acyltransferase
MHHTLFDTPVINLFFRLLARFLLFCFGWKTIGEKPGQKKYVIIAAPHTSNWDLFFMMLIAL